MNELQQTISRIGVVPVIKLTNPTRDAAPLSDALCAGGVPVAEITFRAAGADEAMRIMLERHPDMLVGAGTVLTTEMVDKTIAAGWTLRSSNTARRRALPASPAAPPPPTTMRPTSWGWRC